MEKTRQQFSEEFRRMAVSRMKSCGSVVGLARELGVRAKLLHRWRARLEGRTKLAAPRQLTLEEENRQLKQLLAKRTLEVGFFKGALQKIQARRQQNGGTGGTASTTRCGQ